MLWFLELNLLCLPRWLLRRRDPWHRQASLPPPSAHPRQAGPSPRPAARSETDFTWNNLWTTDPPRLISLLQLASDLLTSPLELLLRHTPTLSSTSRTTTWPGTSTLPCLTRSVCLIKVSLQRLKTTPLFLHRLQPWRSNSWQQLTWSPTALTPDLPGMTLSPIYYPCYSSNLPLTPKAQFPSRLPHPHPALAPLSPSRYIEFIYANIVLNISNSSLRYSNNWTFSPRSQPQGFVPPMPQQQQQPGNVNLARSVFVSHSFSISQWSRVSLSGTIA